MKFYLIKYENKLNIINIFISLNERFINFGKLFSHPFLDILFIYLQYNFYSIK